MTAIGPFSIDMYLPGLHAISEDLQTPIANVQLTLSSFFFGFSFGQLIYGPIIDGLEEKNPSNWSFNLFSSFYWLRLCRKCMVTYDFALLSIIRCMWRMVISRAIVRDVFSPHDGAKVFPKLF